MARYDYGMRGPRETIRPLEHDWSYLGPHAGVDFPVRGARRPPPNRVIARYNLDYVRPRTGERYPRNPNPFGGDWYDRIGDERAYRRPYITHGGTWTWRGTPTPPPDRYDYPDFGPDYGGRYPDEL